MVVREVNMEKEKSTDDKNKSLAKKIATGVLISSLAITGLGAVNAGMIENEEAVPPAIVKTVQQTSKAPAGLSVRKEDKEAKITDAKIKIGKESIKDAFWWEFQFGFNESIQIQPPAQMCQQNLPPSTVQGYLSFTPLQGDVITNVSIMGNTYLNPQQNLQNIPVQWGTINIKDPATGMNEVVNYYTPQGFTKNGNTFQVVLDSSNNSVQNINGTNYYVGSMMVENPYTGVVRDVTYYLQQPQQGTSQTFEINGKLAIEFAVVIVTAAILIDLINASK